MWLLRLLVLALCTLLSPPAHGAVVHVDSAIDIHASRQATWKALNDERDHDPDLIYVKVLKQAGNQSLIEERFATVPLVGSVEIILAQSEVPASELSFRLISSNRIKWLRGSWLLSSSLDTCHLRLMCDVDPGFPVPAAIVQWVTEFKLKRALERIKTRAEHIKP